MQTACPRCQSPLPDRGDVTRCPQCGHSLSGRPRALSGFSGLVARTPSQRPLPAAQPVAPAAPPVARREAERDLWDLSDAPAPATPPASKPAPAPASAAPPSVFRAPTNPAPRGFGVPSSPAQRPRVQTAASVRSTVTLPLAELGVPGERVTLGVGEVGHSTLAMMAPEPKPAAPPRAMGLPRTIETPPAAKPEPPRAHDTDALRETRGFDAVRFERTISRPATVSAPTHASPPPTDAATQPLGAAVPAQPTDASAHTTAASPYPSAASAHTTAAYPFAASAPPAGVSAPVGDSGGPAIHASSSPASAPAPSTVAAQPARMTTVAMPQPAAVTATPWLVTPPQAPPAPAAPPTEPPPPTARWTRDETRRAAQVALALALIVSPLVRGLHDRGHWSRLSLPGALACVVLALPIGESLRATLVTMVALPTLAREIFYAGSPGWWSGFAALATIAALPGGALGVTQRRDDPLARGLSLFGAACAAAWIARAADGRSVALLLAAAVSGVVTGWRGATQAAWLTLALSAAWMLAATLRSGSGAGEAIAMLALSALVATGVAGSTRALGRAA